MRKNYLLFFIIAVVIAGPIFAQDSKLFVTVVDVQGANKSIVITGYNGTEKALVIPASIDGLPVRKIGDGAFRLKGLTEVVIPDGIEVIGNQAFFGNKLELVIIPSSVKEIAASAFDSNMLRRVTNGKAAAVADSKTPAAVDSKSTAATDSKYTMRPANSFSTSIQVQPQLRIFYIAADKLRCLEQASGTDIVLNYGNFYDPLAGFDGKYKPANISQIVSVPAKDNGTNAVPASPDNTISAHIAVITPGGNSGMATASVTLKKGTVLTPEPSPYGAVKEVAPASGSPETHDYYNEKPAGNVIKLQSDGSIGKSAYRGRGLDIIVIPEGTKYIGQAAFYSNNLTSVRIPDSVRFIGSQAFMGNNLTSITIGENVTVQLDSFRYQFSDYYRMNKFNAGTYILKAGHWNYEGNEPRHIFIDSSK
jgi:hypothetical protein